VKINAEYVRAFSLSKELENSRAADRPAAAAAARLESERRFRWRSSGRRGHPGWLQPVRHAPHQARICGIDKQITRGAEHAPASRRKTGEQMFTRRAHGQIVHCKACLQIRKAGLRLIEEKNDLVDLPTIVDQSRRARSASSFCDDLSFDGREGYIALKVALDGSISTTSENPPHLRDLEPPLTDA
jgi:predicted AAA+ superfamily ATPase